MNLIKPYDIQDFRNMLSYYDMKAKMVSNLDKYRTDNNYGRIAQKVEDLIKFIEEIDALHDI